MKFPDDLYYTKEHEWVKVEDDTATIGITDFAQNELGDIVFVELEEIGDSFEADEVFGTVEAVKTVSELFAPVAGEIIEINERLEDEPELVNSEPYTNGWMLKLKMADPAEVENLLSADQYQEII